MTTKTFEIRDKSTFIAVLAIKMDPVTEGDEFLIRKSGYIPPEAYIILLRLDALLTITYSAYEWTSRTMRDAHDYIRDNFDTLESGSVVDIEFIRGESDQPKNSERVER